MPLPDIKREVSAYIANNFMMGRRSADLTDDVSLIERSVIDSTGFLELIAFLEETYGIHVADEEMRPENLDSLSNIDRYVRNKLSPQA
jgi:acyl carrier protein